MGLLVQRMLTPILARLGSRTILGVGGGLFLLNMLIPDPIPLVDEFLILAATILLSRWAKLGETGGIGCDRRRCDRCDRCGRCAGRTQTRRPQFDLAITTTRQAGPHRSLFQGVVSKLSVTQNNQR